MKNICLVVLSSVNGHNGCTAHVAGNSPGELLTAVPRDSSEDKTEEETEEYEAPIISFLFSLLVTLRCVPK